MKCLINDEGRECTCCGEFKQWDEYGNKKRGTRGRQPICNKCKNDLRYAEKHGCLKQDNINTKHYDADKIMDKYINRKRKERKKFYRWLFKKDRMIKRGRYDCMGRECNDWGMFKLWKDFHKSGKSNSPNNRSSYCKECSHIRRVSSTDEQRKRERLSRRLKREKKIKEALNLAGDNSNKGQGFIYLYRCDELDCFKIGRTKNNPFDYVSNKSKAYGLDLKMVAYIISPIRDSDAEWLATKDIKHKKIKHIKPCGGVAHELFNCGLYEALLILRGISDKMYIDPNPFVTLSDLNASEIPV